MHKPLTSNPAIKGYGLKLKQRGLIADFYLYALAALAVIVALGGLYYVIDKRGYDRGAAEIKRDWLAANEEAKEAADKARKAREAEAAKAAASLASASNKAADFESRWRAASRNTPVLAAGQCNSQPSSSSTAVVANSDGASSSSLVLRLDAGWVRQYDSAWTNETGKSIYPDTGVIVSPADAAVAADAILPIHGENAARSSANFRQCSALIDLLTTLRAK